MDKGRTLVEQNQLHQAVEVCRTGLLAEPGEFEGRLILGAALMALGRYQEVVAEMSMALERMPNQPQALALQGEALMNLGDWNSAVRVLSSAVRAEPQNQFMHSLYNEAKTHRERNAAQNVARTPAPAPWPAEPTVNLDYALISGEIRKIEERPLTQGRPAEKTSTELSADDILQVEETSGSGTKGTEVRAIEVGPQAAVASQVVRKVASAETVTKAAHELGTRDVVIVREAPPKVEDPTTQWQGGRADSAGFDIEIISDPKIGLGDPRPIRAPAQPAKSPQARPPSNAVKSVDELFPDDERGVSRMIELDGLDEAFASAPASASDAQRPQRVVRLSQDPPQQARTNPSSQPTRAKPESKPPDTTRSRRTKASTGPKGGVPSRAQPNTPSQKSRAWRDLASQARESLTRHGTERKPAARAGVIVEIVFYLVLTVVVMGGAVYAGYLIRDWRLGDEIARARAVATEAAKNDTLSGYLEALETEERIVAVANRSEFRAGRARARAALAAEFGYDKGKAAEQVAALSGGSVDAIVARAYLGLANGDEKAALEAAEKIPNNGKVGWTGPYLVGRAALLAGDLAEADDALNRARKLAKRPVIELAIADLAMLRGRSEEALQAIDAVLAVSPRHPGALARQGVLVGVGHVSKIDKAKLEPRLGQFVLAVDKKSPADEVASAGEIGWLALGQGELLRVRGDLEGATRAYERAQKQGNSDDRAFATLLGIALLRGTNLETARRHIEPLMKRWPSGAPAAMLAAELALAEGDFASVETRAGKEPTVRERSVRARARLLRGQWDDAELDLRTLISQESFYRQALESSALLALRRARPEVALELLKPLFDQGERADIAVLYAEAMGVKGDGDTARTTLSEAFSSGSSALAAYVQAHALRKDGQVPLAQKAYADCIRRDPGFVPARWELALLVRDSGDRRAARTQLDELSKIADYDGAVLLAAAELAIVFGDHDRARALLDRAGTLKDAAVTAWHVQRERGRILYREGDIPGAVRSLERAKSLQPTDRDTNLLLIQVYAAAGTVAAVEKSVKDISDAFPQSSAASLALGIARLQSGKSRDAQSALAKAESLAATEKASALWLSEIDYWQGRAYENDNPAKAATYVDRAIERTPDHAGTHFLRGNIYFDASDAAKAIASYQKSIEIDPRGYPKAYFFLGTMLADAKQTEEAKKALQTFLERSPNDVDAEEAKALLATL